MIFLFDGVPPSSEERPVIFITSATEERPPVIFITSDTEVTFEFEDEITSDTPSQPDESAASQLPVIRVDIEEPPVTTPELPVIFFEDDVEVEDEFEDDITTPPYSPVNNNFEIEDTPPSQPPVIRVTSPERPVIFVFENDVQVKEIDTDESAASQPVTTPERTVIIQIEDDIITSDPPSHDVQVEDESNT